MGRPEGSGNVRIDRVMLVGCGGIGSLLAEPLARLLMFHEHGREATLVLVDGDRFEPHNAARQLFPAGLAGNKADVTRDRLTVSLGFPVAESVPSFMDAEGFAHEMGFARSHRVFILAVDNVATHRVCLDALDDARGDVTILRPGNGAGDSWGLVSVCATVVRRSQWLTADPRDTHEEIMAPRDVAPRGGCAATIPGEPQRLASNMLAAAMTVAYVSAILDDRMVPDEWMGELTGPLAWRGGPAGELVDAGR